MTPSVVHPAAETATTDELSSLFAFLPLRHTAIPSLSVCRSFISSLSCFVISSILRTPPTHTPLFSQAYLTFSFGLTRTCLLSSSAAATKNEEWLITVCQVCVCVGGKSEKKIVRLCGFISQTVAPDGMCAVQLFCV